MLRQRAAARDIDFSVIADDVGVVHSDELRLKQVVLNLVTNAVKFTGDGGSVVIRAEHHGHRVVSPSPTAASACPRRTASGSSSHSSKAVAGARKRRARASASPCRAASWSYSVAGCGWRAR